MGKPRLIILIRHAQSEGNKNRDIHQTIPDHRVKLTPDGRKQAEEAGRKLRSLLHPTDTLHFFTSPYRRTRETTDGILNSLTADTPSPSPFPRSSIKVYEEPRLREQDFGNFQPDSAEMARMWRERAEYGHFFYRIPNGESAADAYDRISGFNESLWRGFGEEGFASVCVLVTHGLMTRVFLMKWYHFSVEYFEDLRNVDHCEFVVMRLNPQTQKYVLQNQLRTWSEMSKERDHSRQELEPPSPVPVRKKWDGCEEWGRGMEFTRRQMQSRRNTADLFRDFEIAEGDTVVEKKKKNGSRTSEVPDEDRARDADLASTSQDAAAASASAPTSPNQTPASPYLDIGRDGGGSRSGSTSPNSHAPEDMMGKEFVKAVSLRRSMALALNHQLDAQVGGAHKERVRADALGDQSDVEDEEVEEMRAAEESFEGAVR